MSHGTLTLNADGGFTYTPNAGFSGPDSFTYHANDGTADSNIVTVSLGIGNSALQLTTSSYVTFGDPPPELDVFTIERGSSGLVKPPPTATGTGGIAAPDHPRL